MQRPNIVLLTIDTLRTDRVGCYGHDGSWTAHIDRLAKDGLLFKTAITGGSWTQAAFPALLTSTYPATYGGCLGKLSADRPSPIEILARRGYETAAFSTNPHLSRVTGYDRGFDKFVDLIPHDEDPILRRLKGGQILLRKPVTHRLAQVFGRRMAPGSVYTAADGVTEAASQWLATGPDPFFLWVHYMDVHWPYHLEKELAEPDELAQAWRDLALMHRRSSFKRDGTITSAQQQRFIRLYETAVQFLDRQIGRLLDFLEEMDYLEDTIVVVASDHGEEFLDHGRWGHWESNLYDEIIKVPLIIRLPAGSRDVVIERQVRLLDLMPTLLELCGSPAPDGLAGESMVPLWAADGRQYQPKAAISEMHRPPWHRIAVRTEAYKYIWDSKQPHEPELYDLTADPGERENVAAEHPEEVRHFQAIVDAHRQRVRETEPDEISARPELDESTIRRLRALGYVD